MRVICRLRHLEAQRARWTLPADSDSSSRHAAPEPAARQAPAAASQRQTVRAAPGTPGTMAAGQGRRRWPRLPAPRRGSTAGDLSAAATPLESSIIQLQLPADLPPCSASRGGVMVTEGLAIGWKESE